MHNRLGEVQTILSKGNDMNLSDSQVVKQNMCQESFEIGEHSVRVRDWQTFTLNCFIELELGNSAVSTAVFSKFQPNNASLKRN